MYAYYTELAIVFLEKYKYDTHREIYEPYSPFSSERLLGFTDTQGNIPTILTTAPQLSLRNLRAL